MIDIQAVRADTPGCGHVVHLNNAGASLPPQVVVDAQIDYLLHESLTGGYELAAERREAVDSVYRSVARLIGARDSEIALMSNATDAWNAAFAAVPLEPGDRILTSEAEYASNVINFLKAQRERGVVVEVVPSTASGEMAVAALESMLDDRVKLIAVSHIPTNGGLVNPAGEIGTIARSAGVTYLLDACQSAGQIGLDVDELGCDLLTATGRKYLRGPRGTGFLYVREGWGYEPYLLDLHAARWTSPDSYDVRPDARRFENWEFGYASLIGLGAAVDYALGLGLEAIERRVVQLGEELRDLLAGVPGITIADLGERRCGIVSFWSETVAAGEIVDGLRAQRINLSVSRRASTPYDAQRRNLPDLVRASVHYFNTGDELDRCVQALEALLGAH